MLYKNFDQMNTTEESGEDLLGMNLLNYHFMSSFASFPYQFTSCFYSLTNFKNVKKQQNPHGNYKH